MMLICMCFLIGVIRLVAPESSSVVPLMSQEQRAVLSLASRSERIEFLRKNVTNGTVRTSDYDSTWRKAKDVVFRWMATDGENGPWRIELSKKSDFSEMRSFVFKLTPEDAASRRPVESVMENGVFCYVLPYANLEIGTKYYWRVFSNIACEKFGHGATCTCSAKRPSRQSDSGSFMTEDLAPRWIDIEGPVSNFRDLGGRKGLNERVVRQGLIYRSQGLNQNSVDGVSRGKNSLTISDAEYLVGTLGIRTDLDLRCPAEVAGMDGVSPLGASVNYINNSSSCYDGIFSPNGKRVMARNFRVFTDPSNYPILFHCIGGADRTGALAYVLNGVLGVCRRELETDWESTFYPTIPDVDSEGNPVWNSGRHFDIGFSRYGMDDASWNDRIVLYLRDCGIGNDEIERFRRIMLK